ncbi:glycosyltransferase [Pseudomonas sp. GX19020]|uniref:glycosyltransferase n=1 Tax=Pseudomonas sp. GX19020 TaxID=2942277 RepID=UPI0020193A0C|nr:glycosyltransferase [Pseudomonas sp. GX19020]MCL4067798.1 glycosyltransferase [Pseudomonas sp. GX19020]
MTEDSPDLPALPLISQRYLLSVLIPFYRDPQGEVWLGRLWAHDLRAHLDYIADLAVLAPEVRITAPGPDMVRVMVPPGRRLRFCPFGRAEGHALRVVFALPGMALAAWRAVGAAEIVHSGVAGWPLPPGLVLNPVAVLRRRPLVMMIESAFWRLPDPARAGRKARLRARLTESFARWSMRRARLGVYTSEAYRESLPVGAQGRALVLPASWISEEMILSDAQMQAAWAAKSDVPRFLMASRLVAEKGIGLFLAALEQLEMRGIALAVDVIGEGPMRADLGAFAAQARHVRLGLLDPVEYGAPFMALLRGYHAVVVPTTGDEQPRILFDAFSQGVPVVATATTGNREVVQDGVNGRLCVPGQAGALAGALADLVQDAAALAGMAPAALQTARAYTHATMHRRRAGALADLFGADTTVTADHERLS